VFTGAAKEIYRVSSGRIDSYGEHHVTGLDCRERALADRYTGYWHVTCPAVLEETDKIRVVCRGQSTHGGRGRGSR
jgi:hypothetical protein